jgi:hypothetical protein
LTIVARTQATDRHPAPATPAHDPSGPLAGRREPLATQPAMHLRRPVVASHELQTRGAGCVAAVLKTGEQFGDLDGRGKHCARQRLGRGRTLGKEDGFDLRHVGEPIGDLARPRSPVTVTDEHNIVQVLGGE